MHNLRFFCTLSKYCPIITSVFIQCSDDAWISVALNCPSWLVLCSRDTRYATSPNGWSWCVLFSDDPAVSVALCFCRCVWKHSAFCTRLCSYRGRERRGSTRRPLRTNSAVVVADLLGVQVWLNIEEVGEKQALVGELILMHRCVDTRAFGLVNLRRIWRGTRDIGMLCCYL